MLQFLHQMFNLSTLLLDDTFKPATPLTDGVISETLQQFAPLSDISQGCVATHFSVVRSLVTVILHIFSWFRQWNHFENRSIFDKVKVYEKTVPNFLGHPVHTWNLHKKTNLFPLLFRSRKLILSPTLTITKVAAFSHSPLNTLQP